MSSLAQNGRPATNRSNFDLLKANQASNAMFDHESVVQIRDDENGLSSSALKANREGKLNRKQQQTLRKLASDEKNMEGFLSVGAS